MYIKFSLSAIIVISIVQLSLAQVTINPNDILINRDNKITSQEVLGISRTVNFGDLFGGMYIETDGYADGRPFYGYAINNSVKAYNYFDGADQGLHTYIGGIRQSIFSDSVEWKTSDGSLMRFHGYKLSLGTNGNTIVGYSSVLNDSPSNIGNTVMGSLAAQELTGGVSNTISGNWSAWRMTTGDYNALYGSYTGADLITGSRNTMIGYYAGSNTGTNSTGNVFLGYRAGEDEPGSNKLYIANSETPDPLIYGNFATSELKVNGDTELDGNVEINGTTIHNGLSQFNGQIESQDINIKDSNPYIQFWHNNTAEYYFQYQAGLDQLVLAEVGGGQILRMKNGELYLPQLAGNTSRPLRIESDGRVTAELPNPIENYGLEFANTTSSSHFILANELEDGMTINSLEITFFCSANPVGEVYFTRFPKSGSGGSAQIVFSINPPGNGCGTFSTTTVVTAGSNVIDTDNYFYYFNASTASDASAVKVLRLFH